MGKLFDVTIWDGHRLIATAENIVARDGQDAVKRGLCAIRHRRRGHKHTGQLAELQRYLMGAVKSPPAGIRAFAKKKPLGVKVIG